MWHYLKHSLSFRSGRGCCSLRGGESDVTGRQQMAEQQVRQGEETPQNRGHRTPCGCRKGIHEGHEVGVILICNSWRLIKVVRWHGLLYYLLLGCCSIFTDFLSTPHPPNYISNEFWNTVFILYMYK